jgi:hypothetical protein
MKCVNPYCPVSFDEGRLACMECEFCKADEDLFDMFNIKKEDR